MPSVDLFLIEKDVGSKDPKIGYSRIIKVLISDIPGQLDRYEKVKEQIKITSLEELKKLLATLSSEVGVKIVHDHRGSIKKLKANIDDIGFLFASLKAEKVSILWPHIELWVQKLIKTRDDFNRLLLKIQQEASTDKGDKITTAISFLCKGKLQTSTGQLMREFMVVYIKLREACSFKFFRSNFLKTLQDCTQQECWGKVTSNAVGNLNSRTAEALYKMFEIQMTKLTQDRPEDGQQSLSVRDYRDVNSGVKNALKSNSYA